jgi:hypothetical protein
MGAANGAAVGETLIAGDSGDAALLPAGAGGGAGMMESAGWPDDGDVGGTGGAGAAGPAARTVPAGARKVCGIVLVVRLVARLAGAGTRAACGVAVAAMIVVSPG